jgi:hypothetical protein
MKRHTTLVVCLVATLFTAVGFAQAASAPTDITLQDSTSQSTVAYVYVSTANNQKRSVTTAMGCLYSQ